MEPSSFLARYGGAPQSLTLKLPVTINKFFQPTEMAAQDFFQRWKQLSLPQQEAQKIFKANHPMDPEVTKAKVRVGARQDSAPALTSQPCLAPAPGCGGHGCSASLNLPFSLLWDGFWELLCHGLGANSSGTPLPPQLLGFGSALLDNVDPNPENFVGAGIIQTKALQVGCLLRLEPNAQAQVRGV